MHRWTKSAGALHKNLEIGYQKGDNMSTKIKIRFFSVDEKLPEKECIVQVVIKFTTAHNVYYHSQFAPYSPKHKLFNAHDHNTKDQAESWALRDVVAWAYPPDWSKVDV